MLTAPKRGRLSSAAGRIRPKATTTRASGASAAISRANASVRIFSGCSTDMPSRWALRLTGGGVSWRPRPTGRSG